MQALKKPSSIFILFCIFIVSDCRVIYHDKKNPCTKGDYWNAADCDQWKKDYPKEYEHYIKRINKRQRLH